MSRNDVVSISLPMVPLQALYAALTVALVVGPGFAPGLSCGTTSMFFGFVWG